MEDKVGCEDCVDDSCWLEITLLCEDERLVPELTRFEEEDDDATALLDCKLDRGDVARELSVKDWPELETEVTCEDCVDDSPRLEMTLL